MRPNFDTNPIAPRKAKITYKIALSAKGLRYVCLSAPLSHESVHLNVNVHCYSISNVFVIIYLKQIETIHI